MTVETTDRKQSFAGGQSTLTYTFRSLADHPEYIKVVAVTSGTETLLTYSTEYTVAPASDGIGGVVTVSPSFSTAYTYTVYRDTALIQESDYDDYNQFPADTLEEDLDRRALIDQEIGEDTDRTVKISISSSSDVSTELPVPQANYVIGWNADADALVNVLSDSSLTTAFEVQHNSTTGAHLAITATSLASAGAISGTNITGTGTATFNDASNADCMLINNDGTGDGLRITQDATSASLKYGLHVYGNAAQTSSPLVLFENENASTTQPILRILQDHASSTATSLEVTNDGTGNGIYINQDGNGIALNIDSEATTAASVTIDHDSTGNCIDINNAVSTGIYLNQSGVLAQNKRSLYIQSAAQQDQTGVALCYFEMANGSSNKPVVQVVNAGTGNGLSIDQNGNGRAIDIDTEATDAAAINISSVATAGQVINLINAGNQATGSLVYLKQDHASSAAELLTMINDGTGTAVTLTNAGTGYGISVNQTGVLANNGNAVRIYSNAAQISSNSSLLYVNQDNASSDERAVQILNDGTGITVDLTMTGVGVGLQISNSGAAAASQIINSTNNGTHLRLTGDPTVASPADGDLWYTGSALNFRDGGTTKNLLDATAHELGSWVDKGTAAIAGTEATTDGFLIGMVTCTNAESARILAYTDGNADPTTLRAQASVWVNTGTAAESAYNNVDSFTMPVKAGDYYKTTVADAGGSGTPSYQFYWIPLS